MPRRFMRTVRGAEIVGAVVAAAVLAISLNASRLQAQAWIREVPYICQPAIYITVGPPRSEHNSITCLY